MSSFYVIPCQIASIQYFWRTIFSVRPFMLRFFRSNAPEHLSDEQLLAQYVRKGDTGALGQLFERYMPMVYGVCLKILKDSGKAEDAVMGIYESLAAKVKDHQIESFRGWLYVFARNYCLMEWRKAQRRPTDHHAPEDMVYYDAVDMPLDYELPQETAPLEKCLEQLSTLQRNTVQWFYYEEKSYKEIAELIAEDVGRVRSYIQNGRRNLRLCLEKQGVTGVL